LTKNSAVRILVSTDFISIEENIIYKVAIFIKDKYKVEDGVDIKLEKNIPIAAGLGGGSSNAAFTISALSELWNLNLSDSEMHNIARNFGSDINFFLKGGCALGEGRGDKITPLEHIDINNIFLVNPGFDISSKEAYHAVHISNENTQWQQLISTHDVSYCYNKLEEGICRKYPVIKFIMEHLKINGAKKAMLSGSGATIIGFCSDRKIADNFTKYYSKKKYWNCITKTKRSTR
jgi:4-diphosphocytidyl-2-C-methyl-D-erythritol kinase